MSGSPLLYGNFAFYCCCCCRLLLTCRVGASVGERNVLWEELATHSRYGRDYSKQGKLLKMAADGRGEQATRESRIGDARSLTSTAARACGIGLRAARQSRCAA